MPARALRSAKRSSTCYMDSSKPERSGIAFALMRSRIGLRFAHRLRTAIARRLAFLQADIGARIAPDERVAEGPFAGMLFPITKTESSVILPKLLGSYEEELHGEVAASAERSYTDIIDIGCGDGYYAVGLSLLLPDAHIIAFDLDPVALYVTQSLATLNNVAARVTVLHGCTREQLRSLKVGRRVLLLSDCEGAELSLLHPEWLPRTEAIDLLVECHECAPARAIRDELCRRFSRAHAPVAIHSNPRNAPDYPRLIGFTSGEKEMALSESRPPGMTWLSLRQHNPDLNA